LRHAGGLRIAVLVNDFGELPVDADLIESRDGEVISIAGGCVCCSFGSDLIAALMKLPALSPVPQHVLVETSGVALPAAVARSVTLLPAYRLDGTVVLADAQTLRSRAADRYVGDTIIRQLADADLVVLNKTDLVRPEERVALAPWIRSQAPRARLVYAERAQVSLEVLLGIVSSGPVGVSGAWLRSGKIGSHSAPAAAATFESAAFRPARALDVVSLAKALAQPELRVLRAKGRLRDLDGSWKALHVIGSRWEVSAAPREGSAGLVCIGLAGTLERRAIEAAIGRSCGG
jgi:G3E family GTPase